MIISWWRIELCESTTSRQFRVKEKGGNDGSIGHWKYCSVLVITPIQQQDTNLKIGHGLVVPQIGLSVLVENAVHWKGHQN